MAVTLQKGQGISLSKIDQPGGLSQVVMGLGWDVGGRSWFGLGSADDVDIDASCFLLDHHNQVYDLVYYGHLKSHDGSVVHSGDNLTGEGEGDDERIHVNLHTLPSQVKTLVFTVTIFSGQRFDRVKKAYCRLVDEKTGEEIARYNLSGKSKLNAQIMAKLYREQGEWRLFAIGEYSEGFTPSDLLPDIQKLL